MTDYEQWLAANDRFLADTMAWLRGRLGELAGDRGTSAPPPAAPPVRQAARSRLARGRRASTEVSGDVRSPRQEPATSGLPQALVDAEDVAEPPPLVLLSRRLGLSTFERNVLILCAAMELDTRTASLCARHDPQRPFPTFALALTLFEDPAWDVMSPERPLRHWQLVEISQAASEALVTSALRADERIVSYIKGLNYLDDRLRPLLRPVAAPDESELAPSQLAAATSIGANVQRSAASEEPAVIQLPGVDATSKRLVASHAARELGLHLFELAADALPASGGDLDTFARLWQRESILSPVGLYLDAADVDRGSGRAGAIRRWLDGGPGLVFLDVREPWPDIGAGALILDVAKPTAAEQRDAWEARLGDRAGSSPQRLAGQFDFNLPMIGRIVSDALAAGGTSATEEVAARLWSGCLMQSRSGLEQLAQRLEAKAGWDDLKLPSEQADLLRQIVGQVHHRAAVYDTFGFRARMNRGLGISVLFAGESGTGKTMAAEVVANDLGLVLYRIDLSAVVSKYIGETEKSLRRLFDTAEAGGAILFFDEADALFGKRSEVKDSHDRYANIEINYLLQRMETFQGLAILATNMKSGMDTAFLRRLRFIVSFPFPGLSERKAIWGAAFPAETPCAELDLDRLARLNLTGGSIQNIAVNAAFTAASSGGEVTMPMILTAARTEFRKLDKPTSEADFRWLESAEGSA